MPDAVPPSASARDGGPQVAAEALAPPSFSDLTRERPFMRMWMARLFGTAASQMLLVAIGWLYQRILFKRAAAQEQAAE